jgi:SNF2 family DNA or RNA helicase
MAQKRFKDGETQIFLTSDAGSKGLNLPEATYLLHYERPPLHSLFVQRSDRIHRIDSLADTVYIYSLVARGTIEEGLYELNLRRNDWSDKLLGDDETDDTAFLKASDRKLLLKQGRALHT